MQVVSKTTLATFLAREIFHILHSAPCDNNYLLFVKF